MWKFKSKVFGLVLALMPVTAWGFDCTTSSAELVSALPGTWNAANGVGTLTFQGMTMVLPAGNGSTGQILPHGGGLAAQNWDIPGVFPIDTVTDAPFILDLAQSQISEGDNMFFGPLPDFIKGEEVRLLAGCKKGQISPQLAISGMFQDDEGPVEFETYLFVVTKDLLYGVTSAHLKSMGGHAKRITHWTRVK